MLVFIDDSGDTGFKFERGSSRYFVISLLIFDDDLEAEKMSVAIKQLKRDVGIGDHEEFKFNKSRDKNRELFLQTINYFSFRIRSLIVEKKFCIVLNYIKRSLFMLISSNRCLNFQEVQYSKQKFELTGMETGHFTKETSFLIYEKNSILKIR